MESDSRVVAGSGTYRENRDHMARESSARGQAFPRGGVFNAAVDAVVVMSTDGVVRDWNPAAERMFGYSYDRAVGRELAGLIIPAALRERHRTALVHYNESGEGPILNRRLELFGMNARAELIPVELTVTLIPDSEPPLFAGFLRDRGVDDAAAR
jgi:PAS domain S-box-containing protein